MTSRWSRLGPGLLFAAAAVGVSHLVQSTRAGAEYGLALVGIILLAHVLKYPAFRFGSDYAAATGSSLVVGYRRQGRWALVVYFAVTVGTLFAVQAGVTLVTAGLLGSLLGIQTSPVALSAALLCGCAGLLLVGGYTLLVRVTRVLVGILTVATVAATAVALPRLDLSTLQLLPSTWNARDVAFVVALAGWMPSAIDVSVWQSIWTVTRQNDSPETSRLTPHEARFDFHVGYGATAALALCFVVLGAALLHGHPTPLAQNPTAFASQWIGLYRETLGPWVGWAVGVAGFAVMLSTTLTVLDGFPRALAALRNEWAPDDEAGEDVREKRFRQAYWVVLCTQAAGAVVLLWFALSSLTRFIDFATTLSFLSAPVLALLNHRAMHSADIAREHRPPRWLSILSVLGIVALAGFSLYYLGRLAP